MLTVAIIAAAGEGERFRKSVEEAAIPFPVDKLALRVGGETLMDRTARLLRAFAGIEIVVAREAPVSGCIGKLHPEAWPSTGRAAVLWGDTYYTESAIQQIVRGNAHDIEWFGRITGSLKTGKRYGELFAVTFEPDAGSFLRQAACVLDRKRESGEIERAQGWQIYQWLHGHLLGDVYQYSPNFTVIDDFTEDFDTIWDWNQWVERAGRAEILPTPGRPPRCG